MKKQLQHCFLVLSILFASSCLAQNEATKWYFGNMAGLDFMTSPPTIINTNAMIASNACASIADAAGNMLFYTDGTTVWDQTNSIMANGTGLFGNQWSTQSSVIVKQPGSSTIYYIFTTGNWTGNGFNYSIVDMSLAAGMGSVTTKNTNLIVNNYSEKITAVKHCNGVDTWVITRSGFNNSGTTPVSVDFCAFLVTSAGVNTVPVISPANNPWAGIPGSWTYSDYGCMKASPNGRKLGLGLYNWWGTTPLANTYGYEIYDFNGSTGVVSNSLGLNPWTNTITNNNYSYGVEFSADGTKFYGASPWNNGTLNYNGTILQWDLCAGSPTAVAASQYTVATNNLMVNNWFGSLQLAPDGKIYCTRWGQTALDVINNPNLAGAACNYVPLGQSTGTKTNTYSLPNFVSSYIPATQTLTPFTFTVNPALNCLTATFTAPPTVPISCPASGYSVTGWTWIFGDPASGAANTSTLANPLHNYPIPGTYNVKLAYNYACGADTVMLPVTIIGASLTINTASITCASLGSATVIATGGIGPYSYTWMPTAQSSSVATGLNPGSYSITVVDNGGNCTFTATTAFSSLVPFTGLVSNSSSIACNGVGSGTANIVTTGGSGNQTYLWTDGVNTQTTAVAVGLGAGIHTVTVIDALTFCTVTQFFMITQPPALNPVITASSPTTCAGTSISFTASNSGGIPGPGPGYTYTWTGGPATNTYTATQTLAGNYVYTVNSRDGNNCLSTQTVLAGYIVNPVLTVPHVSICPLETGTLTASGATSYTWNSTGPVSNTFTASPVASTEYTVVGSAAGCTSTPVTASIVIKPLPSPTITSNSPVCNGQSLTLSGSGGVTYTWSSAAGFTSTLQNPVINPAIPGNSGAYSLTLTAANSCTASATTTLTVHPTPTVSAGASTVCVFQTLSLTANSFAGSTYTWAGPAGYASTNQNPTITNASLGMTGPYTVTASSPQGCTNTAITSASVVAMPVPVITVNQTAMCAGSLLTLSGSGGQAYSWAGPSGFFSNTQNTSVPFISAAGDGIYTLSVTTGPCVISTSQSITVYPLPNPAASSLPVCENATLQFTATGGPGNQNQYAFLWSGPQSFTSTTQNPVISPVTYSATGTYSLMVTNVNTTCQMSVTTQAIVLINPVIAATSATVCRGQKATLTASGAQTYTWSGPQGYSSTSAFAIINAANNITPDAYNVIGTAANSCTSTGNAILSTVGLPVPTLTVTPKACINSIISLEGGGGSSYQWVGPRDFYSTQQNATVTAFNMEYAGIYSLTVTNSFGCVNSTTASVALDPLPTGVLINNLGNTCVPFCADFSLQLKSSSPLASTVWQVGGLTFNTPSFRYCVPAAGNYPVTGTFTDALGCSNTSTFEINAYPLPVADFVYAPENPTEALDQVQFTNTSAGVALNKYNWYFIENGGYTTDTRHAARIFENAGTFPVSMVVKNIWGCADTVVKTITIEPDFNIFVPTTFTPNEDNKNDLFMAKGTGVATYLLNVYDRWGEKLFTTTDIAVGWDGFFKGQECKSDVYIWKLSATDKQGRSKSMNGFVTLYR